jgi:predicted lipoprotein with Yx(FWY)xxD motif
MEEMRHRKGGGDAEARRGPVIRIVGMLTLTALLGLMGLLAAGSIAGTRNTGMTSASVSLHKTKLGLILVNSKAHTLYLFRKDKNDKSACSGSCASFWPPLLSRGKPTAGPGVKPSLLGTTKRSNGSLQVTYNKHPLYAFSLDKQAGQTKGEGNFAFGAKWYAVSASGAAVVKTPTTTTTTTGCAYPPCP